MKTNRPLLLTLGMALLFGSLCLGFAAQAGAAAKADLRDGGPLGAAAPDCGGGAPECFIDITLHPGEQITGKHCPSITTTRGFCAGSSTGTAAYSHSGYSPFQGIESKFEWEAAGASRRACDYRVSSQNGTLDALIIGSVPRPDSSTFNVSEAWSRGSGRQYTTRTKNDPGLPGGPLYINYHSDYQRSYIHIYGYLLAK